MSIQINQPFTEDYIRRNLRRYGAIEQIDLLHYGRPEAYVTFKESIGAYVALIDNDILTKEAKNVFRIQPADTWEQPIIEQPDEPMDDDADPQMFMLNDDCFERLFDYLDFASLIDVSEVCQRMQTLTAPIFHRTRKLVIDNSDSHVPAVSLAKFRRYLKHVGNYIEDISFQWHDYDHNCRIDRFLDKMVQLTGTQVQKFRFRDMLTYEKHFIQLAPLFHNLTTLEIVTYNSDYELDIDFVAMCPNLRKFKLLENMVLIKCCKPWPSLEYLSIVGNEYMVTDTFRSFIQQNPQLRCFKFTAFEGDDRIRSVAQYLPNVERLTIFESFPEFSQGNLMPLCNLRHLTKLSLVHVDENLLVGIIECLSRMVTLTDLKLEAYGETTNENRSIDNAMLAMAESLMNLEKFTTRFLPVTDYIFSLFVQRSMRLKVVHMHNATFTFTDAVIKNCARAVQMSTRAAQQQPTHRQLTLFIDQTDFNDLSCIGDSEISQYLKVNCLCRHMHDD